MNYLSADSNNLCCVNYVNWMIVSADKNCTIKSADVNLSFVCHRLYILHLLSVSVPVCAWKLLVFADVALAPNNNEVQIHQFAAGKWKPLETLSEHGQRVTGIDWAPTSNRIVTCGAVSHL